MSTVKRQNHTVLLVCRSVIVENLQAVVIHASNTAGITSTKYAVLPVACVCY